MNAKDHEAYGNYFNSIKVQLELSSFGVLSIFNLYFNSIKVQLERVGSSTATAST